MKVDEEKRILRTKTEIYFYLCSRYMEREAAEKLALIITEECLKERVLMAEAVVKDMDAYIKSHPISGDIIAGAVATRKDYQAFMKNNIDNIKVRIELLKTL